MSSSRKKSILPDTGWKTGETPKVGTRLAGLAEKHNFPANFPVERRVLECLYTSNNMDSLFPRISDGELLSLYQQGAKAMQQAREVVAAFGPAPRFDLSERQIPFPDLASLDEQLSRFQDSCERATSLYLSTQLTGKKRRSDRELNRLIQELVSLWESAFGSEAAWYTNNGDSQRGPFLEFLKDVLQIGGFRTQSNSALVRRTSRVRKRMNF